ncbi:hypothetical protein [Actinocorallia longicatena]|uniref:Uncharacterized protein n=1 Tax=Actinocorallia longicatena TaxID=111803 RepID=A0ABP6QLG5_9ACTN
MRGARLAGLLASGPDGIAEALEIVDGLDRALVHGLARLGPDRVAALEALAGVLAGSSLGGPVADAVAKICAGGPSEERLTLLAAGRAALLGAVHDALLDRFDTAAGRERSAWEDGEAEGGEAAGREEFGNVLAGCRSWLGELAISGWRGVDHDLVAGADQTVARVWAEPGLRRLAVLLDGLAAELRASSPVSAMDGVPVRRWADLWTRGMLLAHGGGAAAGGESVSGRLMVLGADVHEHATAVQVQVHAVLENAAGARLVRVSVVAAKVDTIVGTAVWRLFDGQRVLMRGLAERRVLEVTDLVLLPGGDLLWRDEAAALGEVADPFTTARVLLDGAVAPAAPPLERHPVRLGEPVLLEEYAVERDSSGISLVVDGAAIGVDLGRLPSAGPLTADLVAGSTACVALLRWDGGSWTVQPLAVRGKAGRGEVEAHTGDWALGPSDPKAVKAEAKAGDAVAVLRERAGRLLRA